MSKPKRRKEPVFPWSTSLFDQARGGRARFLGDFGAGEHAGDLFAAFALGETRDASHDALALAHRRLHDAKMVLRPRGDLWRMGYGQDLGARGEPGEPLSHRIGDRAADARV